MSAPTLTGSVAFMPGMRSGAPTVNGTRLPIESVLHYVWEGFTVEHTAETWNITRKDVLVACWFAGTYGITGRTGKKVKGRKWRKRWETWACENHGLLWSGKFDEVPDPPDREEWRP